MPLIPEERSQSRNLNQELILVNLADAKKDFSNAIKQKDTQCIAIIGNEGADMDSCVSALCLALMLREQSQSGECVFPVISVTREELLLRRDITLLFESLGIKADEHLIFIDEVPFKKLKGERQLRLILVDHNTPFLELEAYADSVVGVVDHHADSNFPLHEALINPALRLDVIETVGSVSSLIYRHSLNSNSSVIKDWKFGALLSSTIALDTDNLTSSVTTQLDSQALNSLRELILDKENIPSFEELRAARRDIDAMTPSELLARDRKFYREGDIIFGISSLPTSLSSQVLGEDALFNSGGSIERQLEVKIGNFSSQLYFVHCSFDGENAWEREIALCYVPSASDLGDSTAKFLESLNGFQPQNLNFSNNNLRVHVYSVPSNLSRKLFSPKIQKFLADSNK